VWLWGRLGVITRLGYQDVSREWFWWSDTGNEAVYACTTQINSPKGVRLEQDSEFHGTCETGYGYVLFALKD
jgi:hypothetical protein